ncbi:MAG: diguanylate cyclase protein/HDIG protein, partial [Solirubrobacterales bacterium]|nr:diguanylate cyclase protein/HDIG protein [Solirubrobacterales bacterium]
MLALVALLCVGVLPAQLLFTAPLVTSVWATIRAFGAARRRPARRAPWLCFGGSCAIAAVASVLGITQELVGGSATAGLYLGLVASLALVAGGGFLAASALRSRGRAALLDPLLVAALPTSLAVYLLVLPGFDHGDAVLTAVVVVDLVAFVLAAAGAAATAPRVVKAAILGVMAVVVTADGAAAGTAAGIHVLPDALTPLLWALASGCVAYAARRDDHFGPERDPERPRSERAVYAQALAPLSAIVGYPVVIGVLALSRGDWIGHVAFFGPLFLISTALAFARQAVLLVEQRRAAERERVLGADAVRRSRELEALTGLAATMTEVLEERPVMARGLEALQVAARTSSSALLVVAEGGGLEAVATAGRWDADRHHVVVPGEVPAEAWTEQRDGRCVAGLPLVARGLPLGMLMLVRPELEGPFASELPLLALLADQLAVALQNTRDHQEKLEAAIRDPLTGVYNRRFFYEAFGQEVARHDRYGASAALVLFDIDDFRELNETHGSQVGDDVLVHVARIIGQLVRPSDTFARIGGEEFGLLMPETGQLDALLVAERLRTAVSRHAILEGRPVTLSGGVAALPQDGTTREELQRHADQALYWAKRNGKNMCAVASEAIADDAESVQQGMLAHLHGVVAGIDAEHLHTRDHSENVASYAVAISQELGLDPDRIVRVRRAAFLHDIGKVAVSHTILGKPAALTDEEFEAIKVHPQV